MCGVAWRVGKGVRARGWAVGPCCAYAGCVCCQYTSVCARLRRVDQAHLPRLPPVHALGVRVLRSLPRAALLQRQGVSRLAMQGALPPDGGVRVSVAQRQVHLGKSVVQAALVGVERDARLEHREGEVPGVVPHREVPDQRGRQLGRGRAARERREPALVIVGGVGSQALISLV